MVSNELGSVQVGVGVTSSGRNAMSSQWKTMLTYPFSSIREMRLKTCLETFAVGVVLTPERDRRRISPVRVESWSR